MKTILMQLLKSGKFMFGFVVFISILLLIIIYPIANPGNPLAMIGQNSFVPPGTYVSVYDTVNAQRTFTFKLPGAAERRIEDRLSHEDREEMRNYLIEFGLPEDVIDIEDEVLLLNLWNNNFDPSLRIGDTIAQRRFYERLNERLRGLFDFYDYEVYEYIPDENEYQYMRQITEMDFVRVSEVANSIFLPLGTDNFGSDMFRKLVTAIRVSLWIGLVAGSIATAIGLTLGLLSGYVGGIVDDIIMFFTNLLTVIPGIIILILISYSVPQDQRGPTMIAFIIGITSWVWTTRSVRSQVISLRNRDHVNLSKLSGHSMPKIIVRDILPYIASYVVMAFVLQVASAILAEAGLSMLGLGPPTTDVPTLGIMMEWGMRFTAHLHGAWWAYYPVLAVIALVTFSLNLMNTGLDQIFNPQLRD